MRKVMDCVLIVLLLFGFWRLWVNDSHLSYLRLVQGKQSAQISDLEARNSQLLAEIMQRTDPEYVQREQLRMLEGIKNDPDQVRGVDGKLPKFRDE